jgi:GT2 family glycosyltransferase
LELIIIDNASSDGTQEYLISLKNKHTNINLILNKDNVGFASANNMGIKNSKGQFIIFLNNDVIVTRSWVSRLIKHLENPEIGMVGPVTNNIANEAKINVPYNYPRRMELFAKRYTTRNMHKSFEIPVLALFCAALKRETIEKIGLLDEQFSIGMFEDDDYSLRLKNAGLKTICVEDVFVHHYAGASFNRLGTKRYLELFEANKAKFEEKWNIKWNPHRYRDGVIDI